jgi:hypothetical protein
VEKARYIAKLAARRGLGGRWRGRLAQSRAAARRCPARSPRRNGSLAFSAHCSATASTTSKASAGVLGFGMVALCLRRVRAGVGRDDGAAARLRSCRRWATGRGLEPAPSSSRLARPVSLPVRCAQCHRRPLLACAAPAGATNRARNLQVFARPQNLLPVMRLPLRPAVHRFPLAARPDRAVTAL